VSCPVSVQISPYVHSSLLFSDLLSADAILKQEIPSVASYIAKQFKTGDRLTLTHSNGVFKAQGVDLVKQHKKGELVVVRFVKAIKGFGVTVQLDQKTFGSIELSEITDDITGNVALEAQK